MAVPIRQIAEVALVVSDLHRSERFYTEVLGLPVFMREPGRMVTVRLANGFIGLWLPGVWEIPPSANSAPIRLEGGGRSHIVMYIDLSDADAALENLQRHGVRYFGPRVSENGEVHPPRGHPTSRTRMVTCWSTGRGPVLSPCLTGEGARNGTARESWDRRVR
jgi:catechol 2,3-dioxygenase-like lactoylglutathione lyase family enzyme